MQVVVEVPAVATGEAVREVVAVGRDADDADHRPRREAHSVVHPDLAVDDLEEPGQRCLHSVDQLPEAGDQCRDAPLDRAHVEDLRDQGVARLGSAHRDGAGRAVDPLEVDVRDESVLRPDLAGEAVVRLERDRLARFDLEHGLEVGAERPDHLVAAEAVSRRDGHHAGSATAVAGATVSSSTYTRSMSFSRSGYRAISQSVNTIPTPIQPSANQFAYLIGYVGGNFTYW